MRKVFSLVLAGLLAAGASMAAQSGDADRVLAEVRGALGGDTKLAAVKTLTIEGRTQRTTPAGTSVESEFEMAMELPDKYMRKDVAMAMGNMSIYRTAGFNGDGVINEIDTPPQLAGGATMVFRTMGPGGATTGGEQTPEQKEAGRRAMLLAAKQDFARLAIGMFGQSFSTYPLTVSYGGQAESPDGKADILELKGEGEFAARLFVDTQSRLPLMLSWMAREPIVITRAVPGGTAGPMMMGGGGGHGVVVQGPAPSGGRAMTPEEREAAAKQAIENMKEADAKRKVVEFRLFYSDYKDVDGIRLPHRFQRSVDGKPTEEVTFDRVKVNAKIDAKKFAVSK